MRQAQGNETMTRIGNLPLEPVFSGTDPNLPRFAVHRVAKGEPKAAGRPSAYVNAEPGLEALIKGRRKIDPNNIGRDTLRSLAMSNCAGESKVAKGLVSALMGGLKGCDTGTSDEIEKCLASEVELGRISRARQSWIGRNLDSYGLFGHYTETETADFINDCHASNPIPEAR